MGAGTSAEEFFLKSVNVESIFEFIERTDYLFLYSIKECVEKSDCHEGVYLSEVAEYMKLSIPETSNKVEKETDFNCLFCYCPLNQYEDCPGNPHFIVRESGKKIKDCTYCTFPHQPENYEKVVRFLSEKMK